MTKCTDPHHDHDRNDDLWHRYTDEHGRRYASRCPLSTTSPEDKAKKLSDDQIAKTEEWWNR